MHLILSCSSASVLAFPSVSLNAYPTVIDDISTHHHKDVVRDRQEAESDARTVSFLSQSSSTRRNPGAALIFWYDISYGSMEVTQRTLIRLNNHPCEVIYPNRRPP